MEPRKVLTGLLLIQFWRALFATRVANIVELLIWVKFEKKIS